MKTTILEAAYLPDVAELERLCFVHPWSEAALAHLLKEPHFGVVAVEEGRALAYAGLSVALDEGEITNVATHPQHRRLGLARAVLTALLSEAKARGLCRITLEVRVSNTAARELYASLGFTPCGTRKGFYSAPREDALILEKTIN
ncbi:MAG: ribosomal protein S18-alanine N-acetyltransferase [Clostridia bacterium]|nr:ribosomal protein S18-alanine N-acetyltransferase [Clostridia bacterium]